mgnify:CR=1 FL=1
MSHFVVKYCELRACQHWRIDNKCVKDRMPIANSFNLVANMHDSSVCEVRRQIDKYRLEQMLEK